MTKEQIERQIEVLNDATKFRAVNEHEQLVKQGVLALWEIALKLTKLVRAELSSD